MSASPQSVDPQSFEDARQRVRRLVGEISLLAKQEDLAPEQFHAEFLKRVVTALAAPGGAVWTSRGGRGLGLEHQLNLQETGLLEDADGQGRHGSLLLRCSADGKPILVPPRSGGENGQGANPTVSHNCSSLHSRMLLRKR